MSKKFYKKIGIFFFVLAAGAILFIVFQSLSQNSSSQKTEVIFLDVGQGDAILIQKDRMQILIDGGRGQEILDRLGEFMPMGDKNIEFMVATHPDEDHMGGLVKVLENYEVGQILESGIACDKDFCGEWDELIVENNIFVLDAKMGQEIQFGEDVDIWVLYPFENLSEKEFKNTNDASLILKAVVEGRKYLLTGDTEAKIEEELLRSNLDLDVDILKVSHHGSKNATSAAFLQAVTPEKAVISVGENSYGHPTEEVLTRLKNMNIETFRTDEVGSVKF
ncbi:MAG: ComEC/Rec2 family competence protein [Candidatus Paceibacterota bacterium]